MVIALKKVMRLLSVELWAVLTDMLSLGKSRTKKPKVLYAGLLFFVAVLSVVSFMYSLMIGTVLRMNQSLEYLPAIIMAAACVIIVMTTVFKVKGTVFGFRDYDLLMSLPVSISEIIASRLVILYSFNFIFVIILIVPMMAAYGILAQPSILFYLICSIVMFFLPLVPIVIASFLGTAIALAASKFRHQNVLNILFSIGLMVSFIGLSFLFDGNEQQLTDLGRTMINQVESIYPLAPLFLKAVVEYDLFALVLFIGISILAFFLYTVLVKIIFKKMNTAMMTGTARANFKMRELKTSSPWKALYIKEVKRFFASPLYVLNTGIGIVLLTIGTIAIIFVDLGTLLGDPLAAAQITVNFPLAISFCVVMTCPSTASISLEGRSLWIMKSLPVTYKQVYISKVAVNFSIVAPAILDAAIIGYVLKLGMTETFLLVLVTTASAVFVSLLGLLLNLIMPNFTWISEVTVIKQSAAMIVMIFLGFTYVGIQILLLFAIRSFLLVYGVFLILTIVLNIILYVALITYGKKRYMEL
jgi:ABC-2 type transport system permease protein